MGRIQALERFGGSVAGAALLALAAAPGPWAERSARAMRARLPWRIAGEAAESMARGRVVPWAWGLAFGVAFLPWGVGAAGVGFALGGGAGAALRAVSAKAAFKERSGRAWMALLSGSQLAGTLSVQGGVAASAWGGPRPKGREHPGWLELALRLSRPAEAGESLERKRARRRLGAMALALAGSETAARWLWRRRGSQRALRDWALELSKAEPRGSQEWEIACAMADLAVVVAAAGSRAWEAKEPALALLKAKELSESAIPLLWLGAPKGQGMFQAELALEFRRCLDGDAVPGRWGWARVEGEAEAKRRVAQALARLPQEIKSLARAKL